MKSVYSYSIKDFPVANAGEAAFPPVGWSRIEGLDRAAKAAVAGHQVKLAGWITPRASWATNRVPVFITDAPVELEVSV